MSLCKALRQQLSLLVPNITQMQLEHASSVQIAHPPYPSSPLQMLDEATHRTFLQVQLLCQRLLRHRRLRGKLQQREHLREREVKARRHLVGPLQSERLEKFAK